MQPLEDELDGRSNTGWTSPTVELINSFGKSTNFRELIDVFHRRQIIANLHIKPAFKTCYQLVKFAHFKVFTKDFKNCRVDELLHNTLLFDIANGVKFNFATGRGDNS